MSYEKDRPLPLMDRALNMYARLTGLYRDDVLYELGKLLVERCTSHLSGEQESLPLRDLDRSIDWVAPSNPSESPRMGHTIRNGETRTKLTQDHVPKYAGVEYGTPRALRHARTHRNVEIYRRWRKGEGVEDLSLQFHLTRARIRQLISLVHHNNRGA